MDAFKTTDTKRECSKKVVILKKEDLPLVIEYKDKRYVFLRTKNDKLILPKGNRLASEPIVSLELGVVSWGVRNLLTTNSGLRTDQVASEPINNLHYADLFTGFFLKGGAFWVFDA